MSGEDQEVRAVVEDGSNGGSGSPSPGDTLPWNLEKTQRSRRGGGGPGGNGSVLDPAERAVIRIADERDRVQKKTFTKWVNKHLIKAQRHISDLYEDLRDGHNLISLLEVLSGDSLPREKGRMRFHKLQNVQIALDYLRHRQVKLVNIRNDDIADGNPKLTLGLIWTIILHFQISDIQVSGQSEDMTAKEKLLLWSQRMVEGYQGLRCDNFTSSWRDGRLFNAIIHRHKPMLIDMNKVYRQTNLENLDQAFSVAERDLGVTRLLDPEDVDVPQPDEKSIITYVSSLYDAMPRVPDVQDGVKANELQLRWQEYRELVLLLLQWIRAHTAAFEERRFPSSFEEIEILWCQFLKFKETELPAKEADKNRSKGIYQSLEGAVQAGQLKVPPGYHPLDVEKEWGKLHVAILEREKQLRSEFERLERLQRIVSKLQMEAGLCEEQLNQADALLQSDVRLLAAGKAPQRAGEVERDLDKADGMIRLLFNDVQALKDGRHPQGEQMYRRVYRLHERLVAIRTEYNLRLRGTPRHPELEDSTLRYLQDLLAWVEENQRRVDGAEWGVDLPSVEAQLGSHRGLHQSVEEFRAKIERARTDEGQLSPATRGAYRDCLGRLDLQYAKLLNSSKARLRSLESLHGFVAAATKELMWLSEKEEEEVGFDWSERNSNMAAKKEAYSALMRELELKEKKIKEIQSTGDRLLREDHPARPTVESFQAALQTQWSWMLQLCCCIEAHLKENTAYFQFFSDVREAEEQLRKLQETLHRKYTCDRSITVTRLEDLLQDAQDEKDQLNEYRGHLSGLAKRAKAIVQLTPRNPTQPTRGRVPLLAVCDYKQVEVTVHKGDECQMLGPAQPFHWKVLSGSGSEAAVPSVCFLVPPPNQEALEAVARLEAQHQALVTLWHQLHTDMKSLLAWQSLSRDVQLIRSWSLVTFRTLKPEEQRQALRSLELHYQAFLRDSQDAGGFGPEDRLQAEREYGSCSRHYQQLLQSLEQGEQEESRCQRCISELKDIRLQLEACETRTVHRLRLPLDKEPARECAQRIAEQQKAQAEVEGLGKGVARLSAEAEKVLALPEPSPAAPTLRSELELTLGKLEQVRSLSAIYLEKLKTISLVIRSTQEAEDALRAHEEQLKEAQAVPATLPELEATKAAMKKLRAQAEAQQPVFDALRDELRGAQEVGERLQQRHGERDVEVERWRERVTQLLERWQAVLAQTDVRQRELEQLGRQLRYYRESADPLGAWLQDARRRQEQIQAVPLADSQAVREQLRQEKALLEEIERHAEKVEECQRFAKQYINAIKDYELQLVTYKAQLEPVASPAKKPKVQSGSESVIQEYVDLRTRYSELSTLTSQYIRFISETLRRMEEEERLAEQQRAEERERLAEVEAALEKQRQLAEAHAQAKAQAEREAQELQRRMQEEVARREEVAVDAQQQKRSIQEELQQLRQSSEAEIQAKARQVEAAERSRLRIEEEIRVVRLQLETTERQRGGAEGELQALRARAEEAEAQKRQAQEEAERLRRQVQDETQRKRQAEAELALRVKAEAEAAREKQRALQALEELRLQAEEAERRLRQAEAERARQVQVALETAQRSAQAELQSKHASFAEKTAQLERTLEEEHVTVVQLREEATRREQQQAEAERAREEAERELERWQLKANEALRLRLQAEEVAQQKSLAQAEAEKQKEAAEREARRRGKAEEQAVRQRELAEQELERQRQLAEGTAQQRLAAEQELIRLRAETEQGEQQRQLLEEELARLQSEAVAATQKRQELEAELAKVRAEMEVLLASKARAEEESRSSSEKSKQRLEAEAGRFRELAEEAARLRALAEEAKRQRQLAEEDAARQRAEAERVLAEKLAAISEATRLKTEAEIALKEKEAENERLRRLAEDEAFQRRKLEEQAAQHKADIEERLAQLRKASESELERQKGLVEDTLRQRRQVEEEILALKASFEKAAAGKAELELELGRIRGNAEDTLRSKEQAEQEAARQRQLAAEEERRRREAEERVQKSLAAEEEAARQRKAALEEVERLKAKVEEARRLRERAEHESARQLQLAQEAAQKRLQAEEKAHAFAVQQKEQELQQTLQQEQSVLERLRGEAEAARRAAEEAEEARERAEREAAQSRQRVEEAERLKQAAEEQAQAQAQAQAAAEKLRKEAEQEAARRAQAEQAALRQKQAADAEMEKHKKFAEQTLRQKAQVEQELTALRLQLEETDHQKSILDQELQRLKAEVTEAARQRSQVEEELFSVRVQMEELGKLKARIEAENRALILRDKDNTQRLLQEEAEKMKQVAEEAARLSVAAQEAARLRQLAEEDLAQQRALAEKMLKEKMQAVQEATRLKAEAELLQQQKELAQEQARRLQEDKEQMAQQLAQETQGFQRTLETERQRQLEMSAEAERLRLRVAEMSRAQARAEEDAQRFRKQAEEIGAKLHRTELATQEKVTLVQTLETQRQQSDRDANRLREAIAELEREKDKLKKEAELLQLKSEEQEQLLQETQALQQSFLSEKDSLLQRERFIEEEKAKLERLFQDEVAKAQKLREEQQRQQQQMQQEKQQLLASMEEAQRRQREAEEGVRRKQEELQLLEQQRQQQEQLLAEENRRLRERLEHLEEEHRAALAHSEEITAAQAAATRALPNGQDVADGPAAEPEHAFEGLRQKVPALQLQEAGILSTEELQGLAQGRTTVVELTQREDVRRYLQGHSSIAGLLLKPGNEKLTIYAALRRQLLSPGTALILLEAQAASGFLLDPVRNRRLTVTEAVKEGVVGPELHHKLLSAERAVTGYKDPYTGQQISLFQAMKKDLIVREHGIRLLEAQIATGGVIDPVHSHRVPVDVAYKRGYFDEEMNRILQDPSDDTKGFFDPNTHENLTYMQLLERCVEDPETGLRLLPLTDQAAKVPASELLAAGILSSSQFDQLKDGKTSVKDLSELDSVRTLLQGSGCLAGIYLEESKEKVTIYEAMRRGLLRPSTAILLLEAQAATGFLVDPVRNQRLYVHEAVKAGVVGPELHEKLLSAEKAVTGYKDPYSGSTISLFQAMKKGLVVREHGIRLLEAQIATGGVIDPVHSHRVPVDVAYQRGYFDEEMNRILQDPSDDTKGFFDPNTHENLTYTQLLRRCRRDEASGLLLLPLSDARKLTFRGLRKQITVEELVRSHVMDEVTAQRLQEGLTSIEEVSKNLQKFLEGTSSIAGVLVDANKERLSVYQAMKKGIIRPGTAFELLEAQAATGYVIDPIKGLKLTVEEAVRMGIVGPEFKDKLLSAERAVTGYKDPYSGKLISLFQAMKKGLILKDHGIRLLEAQIATGGIIDPEESHRLPVDVAYQRGLFDEEMNEILTDPSDDTKGFFDPNTEENLTYLQLMERCVTDPQTGLRLLPLKEKKRERKTSSKSSGPLFIEHSTRQVLSAVTATVSVGRFQGQPTSLWELLFSEAVPVEQRVTLTQQHKHGALSVEELAVALRATHEQAAATARTTFAGLRVPVTPGELLRAEIIGQDVYEQLEHGQTTAQDVASLDSVQRYLQGTGCIAGLLVPGSQEPLSIHEAYRKGLLRPGTALILLEAQAATGFIIDPKENRRYSVEEALRAGVIGPEMFAKLLSAERAVTGYTDPYTGQQISLFQAMKKDLIMREHGIRLLEAQIATGGVIDPVHSHRVPVDVAYQRGYFDEEMNRVLEDPSDDTKGFFDPNTHENLTYVQLLRRCVHDPDTGLYLLPLKSAQTLLADEATRQAFQSLLLSVQHGRFRGRRVSAWELVNSEYISEARRRWLLQSFRRHQVSLEEVVTAVTTLVEASERQPSQATFRGLRKQLSANDLFRSQLIDKKTLDELSQGKRTVQEVAEMDHVRRYLEGGSFIAGVLIQDTKEKMSISEALRRNVLRPGTALVLLEAQAATGFLIDPVENCKLTVQEAFAAGMFGRETYQKLLSAERAVTGYTDPYTGEQISLFQAMKKDLIVREHGIRLLEAQIATGGIIDPVHSHRVPVDVAYQRGYFDEEMNRMLEDPSDDTKGFFDPNTHENLTYVQLLRRCVEDPETGLYMLQIVKKGETYESQFIDETTRRALEAERVEVIVGRFKGQRPSVWELLNSEYVTEEKKLELVRKYKTDTAHALEKVVKVIFEIISEKEKNNKPLWFRGIRKHITASELLTSSIISRETLQALESGQASVDAVTKNEVVRRYLEGTGCIAGVLVPTKDEPGRQEKMSIYQAMWKGVLRPGTALVLLEAQAATGFVIDPVRNQKLSVEEAVAAGVVGGELQEKLLSAERAVTGYTDPYTGQQISLFQAMKKDLIVREHGIRLLEAQIATGGVIDPVHSHRVPVDVAYQRGYFDEEMNRVLEDPSDDTKGFFDPNTHENLTYVQLLRRCVRDPDTGLYMLQLAGRGSALHQLGEELRAALRDTRALRAATMEVRVGRFQGRPVSVWEVLFSSYLSQARRDELLAQHAAGALALPALVAVLTQLIEETEERLSKVSFRGLRRQVSASELHTSGILGPETLRDLAQGTKTLQEVTEMDSVKRYLEGTSCIAGVLVPAKDEPGRQEKMSIYQAMWKGVLRPGTALVLLEAQAATGFVIDPVRNQKLSVEEAVAAGVVGGELQEKLLSAERAVTGYTDPYTGQQISLFQAMKKDLIVREHGIRLLEAQIATGGVIDPVHSHRVPVDVAYQRGYFDEEMNRVLEDPSDDTKGFFDPNTHENLTYVQLLRRCVRDPDTGLYMLQLAGRGSALHQLGEELRAALRDTRALRAATMEVRVGRFQGRPVSVWEVLFSSYLSQARRDELLAQHAAGALALPALVAVLTQLIEETEERLSKVSFRGLRRQVSASELHTSGILGPETLRDLAQGTKTLQEVTEMDSVKRYLEGTSCIAGVLVPAKDEPGRQEKMSIYQAMWKGVLRPGTALVLLEAQAATGFVIDPVRNQKLSVEEAVAAGVVGGELQEKLLSAERAVTGYTDPYTGQQISLFQAMKKDLIVREHGIRLLEAQIATGGVIDPVHSHRVPVDVAYQRGYFDEEMNRVLEDPSDDTKGFFDPNTHENLTYVQLLRRCVRDPDTGLYMLQLAGRGSALHQLGEELRAALRDTRALRAATMEVRVGRFQGRPVSVWEVLFSSYLSQARRDELLAQHAAGALALPALVAVLTQLIEETEERLSKVSFRGLRRQVSASELHTSGILGPETLRDLAQGTKTLQEVTEMDSVKRYLEGTSCIAGVLVPAKDEPGRQEKMSIYQAMWKGVLRPGTALVLLEAQAATGFVIDPVRNQKLSVEEAVAAGVVGGELQEKLLSAERAVTGYTDPYTGQQISLFQAMKKDLIVREHGIRLLEAQIATGGVIDPVHSHRVPVDVAYQRGYFDEEMNRVLEDPSDDTKGFFDPNTHENLTYVQLLRRCVRDPDTGLYMLQLAGRGSALHQLGEELRAALRDTRALRAATMEVRVGRFQGRPVSVWEVLFSSYLSQARRDELLAQHAAGALALPALVAVLTQLIEETEERLSKVSFRGLRRQVSASELHTSGILGPETLRDLAQGTKTLQEVTEMDSVKRYLEGTSCIAGVLVPAKDEPGRQEKMSIYQAMWKGVLRPGTALVLLEAQAATGFVIDPVRNQKLSVEEAVAAGVVGGELQEKLLSAERAVTGYTDPYTGQQISLFQAMKKDLIVREHGIRLLEAQIATGGVIDPVHSHRVPVDVAYQRGYFDEEMNRVLEDPSDDTKGFFDPNTHENLTYVQLLRRCVRDPDTGLYMLQLAGRGSALHQLGEELRAALRDTRALRAATMEVRVGRFQGRPVSVWEVLFSSYLSQARRDELLAQHAAGALALPALVAVLTQLIEETEERLSKVSFRGLRRQVSASELHTSGILGPETLRDLAQGTKTLQEVTEMDSVKRYLEGTSCIAGVLVPAKDEPGRQEKMSIYQAMWKGVLRPGTALVLLEAQAATGFVIDPVRNQKLSVEEAVAAGVVGGELQEKLLSAERAVTGYTDPYTGQQISLFQAMKKDLIVREHGIRLLEAQIATGGVIDPVHSHRVPVDVAYQRGYFDEEMNRVLEDPSDDTKGFFDPNTHENLTYVQLLRRCVRDPDTGLYMLQLAGRGSALHQLGEELRAALRDTRALRAATMEVRVGRFQGRPVSVWEVLFSSYLSQARRDELLAQHAAGALALPALVAVLTQLIEETEEQLSKVSFRGLRRQVSASELHTSGILGPETLRDLAQGTKTLQEVTEMDSVKRYLEGTSCIAGVLVPAKDEPGRQEKMSIYQAMWKGVLRPGTALVLLEAQAATGFVIDPVRNQKLSVEEAVAAGVVGGELQEKLLSAERAVTGYTDPYTGQQISLFQAMKKDLIVREHGIRLLEAQIATGGVIDPVHSHRVPVDVAYQRGYFDEEMNRVLEDPSDDTKGFFDPNTHENLTYVQLLRRCVRDPDTGLYMLQLAGRGSALHQLGEELRAALRDTRALRAATMEVRVGRFQGRPVSVWEVLFSSYLSQARRDELLAQHAAGALALPALVAVLTQLIEETEERLSKVSFRGLRRQVSASELHTSGILGPETLRDLAQGTKTLQEVTEMDSVKRYLEGTSCIAGVLVPAKDEPGRQEKMSIYQAMWKGVLRPGTALVLLEAQAATGFVIDPVRNQKLSVEEAVAAGVVGGELQEKLLSAERAVTGYTDPYTGQQISLFQAMKKDLIVREHGIRLLEAQIATGGVIDPVHSHRVPVDVAYQRGYFDEEMNRVLEDPSDDTKGFFDPNTHENLTYVQLLQRATPDPETGLLFLSLTGN
uniref:Uncharacterized protein n=1 Tax=Rangifer tarandus platyrhynchus TaxID=3082113 RepID=A0ACB0DWD4_RANTA|nr:unnamed protein product [Rangifer tarandus platyrhynchus]